MNSQFSQKANTFTKESLKKQFRPSEYIAEKIISSVAFLSIATIFLIFIFVFKESIPLFSFGKDSKETTEISGSTGDKPETYGATEELTPDTYGAETTEDLQPETYGEATEELVPETYGAATEELTPETYGAATEDLGVSSTDEPTQVAAQNEEGANSTWSTFLSTEWVPVSDNPRFGLIGLLIGTLKVTIIAMLIAGPLAVLAALYTCCFASKRVREIIKPIIEMLAAFPSVVIGFFALMVLASFFQDIYLYHFRRCFSSRS
jgi:phosphate transport system permease protein